MEARLRLALGARSLRSSARALRVADGRTTLATDSQGRCLFLEPGGLCAVHRQLGHDALPVSCRMFPRVCLLTPRGVSITLSHYCPTAARLLFDPDPPFAIVADAAGFPASAGYEGLDAREAPPPLLRPGVWLGWDGHEQWERHVVDVLSRDVAPEDALSLLAAHAEAVRAWTVDRGPFLGYVADVLSDSKPAQVPSPDEALLYEEVLAAVPHSLRPQPAPPGDPGWAAFALPLRRYLAARSFASWTGLMGAGLRTWVRSLQASLAVARREAARSCEGGRPLDEALLRETLRRSDLLLVHLASPEALAATLSRCERTASIAPAP